MPTTYQKILIAYDHSDTAKVAARKAVEIGKKFNSEYSTIFVMTAKNKSDEPGVKTFIDQLEASEGVNLNLKVHQGAPFSVIVAEIKRNEPNMVVMGSHGMEGFMPQFLGSTAFKVANSSPCPVLIIPEAAKDFIFDNILMPVDSSSETRQKFGHAAMFAKAFGSVVHVLGVSKSKNSETQQYVNVYSKQAQEYMANRGVQYGAVMQIGTNVAGALIEYATKMNCGIILSMTENESVGFMMGNAAQQLVNTSPIPVMCIPNTHVEGIGGGGL